MLLEDKRIMIQDIFLDPYNPRFPEQQNMVQKDIIDKIFKSRGAKDLLQSMQIDIKWVNKIVVIGTDDLTEKQRGIIGISKAKYLVVEGNNRLACLKSGKISGVNHTTKIPILVAKREEDESVEDFLSQIRVTQGIANVMVVKEWGVIAKSKHVYNMYCDIEKREYAGNDVKPQVIHKKISSELGLKIHEVRQMVTRYEFYKTINDLSDTIPESHWGYLEAFDRNVEIREKLGMSPKTYKFDLEAGDGYIEEILKELPTLISKAAREINTKQFRDVFHKMITDYKTPEQVFEFIQKIVDDNDFRFKNIIDEQNNTSEEESWNHELDKIEKMIRKFPNQSEWSYKFKEKLKLISEIALKQYETVYEEDN
jgi:hypothetical protein